jgi:hypothetical protein
MKTFTAEAAHIGIDTIEEAREVVSSWNGKDEYFTHNGTRYSEDDVSLLSEIIEE